MWPFSGGSQQRYPDQHQHHRRQHSHPRRQEQTVRYVQTETQTQQQAVYLEQTKTCLNTLGSYLDAIVAERDPSILSAAGGTVNSLISLMQMSGRDMRQKGMTDGLSAAEGMIREYERTNFERYGNHERAAHVLETATELLMRTVVGEELPAIPVMDSGESSSSAAGAAVNNFIMGDHQVQDLHRDVGENEARYRAIQREAAAKGQAMDAYERRDVNVEEMTKDLQGKLVYAVDKDEAMRQSRRELKKLQTNKKTFDEAARAVDEDGEPDLLGSDYKEGSGGIALNREETIEYVKALDQIYEGDRVDAYCNLFGGLWGSAVVRAVNVDAEHGPRVFRVEFEGCGGKVVRDVSYGSVHRDGAVLRGENVFGGDEMALDEGIIEKKCARNLHRLRSSGHRGEQMDVDQ